MSGGGAGPSPGIRSGGQGAPWGPSGPGQPYLVDEALKEPLGGVNPRGHLLLILMADTGAQGLPAGPETSLFQGPVQAPPEPGGMCCPWACSA